ncbi:hypothetical protein INS49_009108 [Diaporthe citri]|uniref:uncharacterized protein n=1 Tax=Diaporthe citri TaxID=83186 RepID=UPI001C800C09|nr:uncharacterized protein INS49_009108 [Diaporthe citri]KAG6364005.1 hypothetical protein INS49_009108 [Diaporthe citri]
MSLLGDSFALGLDEKTGQSLSDVWDLPTGLLFCNGSADIAINHNYVTDLINGQYAGRANSALLRAHSGEVWKIGTLPGTQIYVCNFGEYDVPFSVAEYDIVDGILNENCQDLGGWVLFPDWQILLGRDATNDDGSFRFACGNNPPPPP